MAGVYRAYEHFGGRSLFVRPKIAYVPLKDAKHVRPIAIVDLYPKKLRSISIDTDVAERFQALKKRWQEETRHLSSITQIVLHPAYQQIIGIGPPALPFIFRELVAEAHHWFWALNAITGQNPVASEDVGNITKMRDEWLRWANTRGYL